jgi:hypothetical protein
VTDLFVVGLGFDMIGAVLLAKGLLINPATIYKVAGTFWGLNVGDAVDRASNRVDAKFGVGCLVGGFLFQAVGYTVALAGADASTGADRAITAVALMALAMAAAYGAYVLLREGELKRTLAAMVASKEEKDDDGNQIQAWTIERAKRLRDFGVAAGWDFDGDEDDEPAIRAYLLDVFQVDVPPFPEIERGDAD